MSGAELDVTGLVAIVTKNVIHVTNESTILAVTGVVTGKCENVISIADVSTVLYVTVRVACVVIYVIAFPDCNENKVL